jgi:hypothetical protein
MSGRALWSSGWLEAHAGDRAPSDTQPLPTVQYTKQCTACRIIKVADPTTCFRGFETPSLLATDSPVSFFLHSQLQTSTATRASPRGSTPTASSAATSPSASAQGSEALWAPHLRSRGAAAVPPGGP